MKAKRYPLLAAIICLLNACSFCTGDSCGDQPGPGPSPGPGPRPAPDPTIAISEVSGGADNLQLITGTHQLYVTGNNRQGQIGLGQTTLSVNTWTQVGLTIFGQPVVFSHLKRGFIGTNNHTDQNSFFIGNTFQQYSVFSTGSNTEGQRGIGNLNPSFSWQPSPVYAGGIEQSIRMISGNANYSVALDMNGHLWGTGLRKNADGSFNPYGSDQQVLSNLDLITGWARITIPHPSIANQEILYNYLATGYLHTVFIDRLHHLWGAGDNQRCQLGIQCNVTAIIGAITSIPVNKADGSAVSFRYLAANQNGTIAIDIDNHLWVAGDNSQGQLGLGSQQRADQFTEISVLDEDSNNIPIAMIALSNTGAVAVGINGKIFVTGLNFTPGRNYTILGLPTEKTEVNTFTPLALQANESVFITYAHTTDNYTVLIDSKNYLWVTGKNDVGQLGTGNEDNILQLKQINPHLEI